MFNYPMETTDEIFQNKFNNWPQDKELEFLVILLISYFLHSFASVLVQFSFQQILQMIYCEKGTVKIYLTDRQGNYKNRSFSSVELRGDTRSQIQLVIKIKSQLWLKFSVLRTLH